MGRELVQRESWEGRLTPNEEGGRAMSEFGRACAVVCGRGLVQRPGRELSWEGWLLWIGGEGGGGKDGC